MPVPMRDQPALSFGSGGVAGEHKTLVHVIKLGAGGDGDRFRLVYEVVIPYCRAGTGYRFVVTNELSECETRAMLATIGATDVDLGRLLREA